VIVAWQMSKKSGKAGKKAGNPVPTRFAPADLTNWNSRSII